MKALLVALACIISFTALHAQGLNYKEYKESEKPRLRSEGLDKAKEDLDRTVRENNWRHETERPGSERNYVHGRDKAAQASEAERIQRAQEALWAKQRADEAAAIREHNLEVAQLEKTREQLEKLKNQPLRTMDDQDIEDLRRACAEGAAKSLSKNAGKNAALEVIGLGATPGIGEIVMAGAGFAAAKGCLKGALKMQWEKAKNELDELKKQREQYRQEMQAQQRARQNATSINKSNCTISAGDYDPNNLPPGVSVMP